MSVNRIRSHGWLVGAWLAASVLSQLVAMAQTPAMPDTQSYRLIHADAAAVGPQLSKMLDDYGAEGEVLIDRAQNRLVVRAPEATRQLVGQLIRTLDKETVTTVVVAQNEQRGTVKGYPVNATQIDALADLLRKRFPASMGVRIATDTRTSQLVVIAPDDLHPQIEAELRKTPKALTVELPAGLRRASDTSMPPYRLQHITWREFENSLRSLWSNSLEIIPDALGELTSVYTPDDPNGTPILRLNRQTNEISFTADDSSNRSWRQIALALDRSQSAQGVTTQLVPLRRADPAKVREAITAIRDAALRTAPGESMAAVQLPQPGRSRDATNLVSMIFQPAGQAQETPGAGPPPTPQAQPPDTPEGQAPEQGEGGAEEGGDDVGLLGDVQIEFIPELGIIILRGKRSDVQRVQAIIDQIEAESKETQPEVEVVILEQTNSEAMTEVVTQIYTEVYAPRLGSLSITALVKPNAILLVGRKENIATAKDLISKLDQPVAPDTQIRVFRLLHMPALNAQTYVQSLYGGVSTTGQAAQAPRGLSARVVVIGDYRSNSLIVQASPRDLDEVAEVLRNLDVDKIEAMFEVRIFPLQNSLASDLQLVLQNTLGLQTTGVGVGVQQQQVTGANQQTQASRSVQIVGIDQQGNKIIESGLMTEVTVSADDNSNALVVKAPSQSMGLIAALVAQLDKIPSAESQIKVFQIKNGDATNLTIMLQQLFGQPVTAGSVGVFSQTVGRTFGAQQTLTQTTAGESSLIPLSFGVDARTNSIIASGSRGDLAVVEAILLRLDEGDLRQRKLMVYRLNNAPAQFVADSLTTILTQQQNLLSTQQNQQFSLISQFEFIDQQIYVVPENISNTLIVSATPTYFEQITEVIQDLDRRPPMVMIQVVACLVRLSDGEELGVELGIQDSLLFDRSATAAGLLDPGFDFVNRSLGNASSADSLATRGLLAGQAFGAYGVGRSSASEGFPGLVLSASNESISILIRALVSKSRAQVLSRPQIMTMNNVPASVLVGQRIPQITDFQTLATGGTVNSVDLIDVGVSLGVIPRVTPDGLVIMDLEVNDSRVGDPAEGITIGVSDGIPIQSPIYDDVTAITTIACRSGQTVVFGGLIQASRTDTFRGVPYLAQLPVVGQLFRFDTRRDERTELIFFLTPHIVMDDADIEALNQREADRMSWCLADVIEAHGETGFHGGRSDVWSEGTPVIYPHVDPTADGAFMMDGAEAMPVPPGQSVIMPRSGEPGQAPFILPPDERTEGKPWVNPPDQQQEGKPFILPPGEREPGKPFLETPQPSNDSSQTTPLDAQSTETAWRPPQLRNPWQRAPWNSRSDAAVPPQPRYGEVPPAYGSEAQAAQGVVPAQYWQPSGGATNDNQYAPPPYPPSSQVPPTYR